MTGGTREEFTRVSAKDVTAALASLTKDLKGQFDTWLAAPDELPAGSTVFAATGKLSTPTPNVDPATLINVEEPTFQLGATATGTVVAVDASLVEQVATERISGSVPPDHRLVPGTVRSPPTRARPTAISSTSGSPPAPRRSPSSTPPSSGRRSGADRWKRRSGSSSSTAR